ncbi:MAG TPA: GGDEF domain-containing protein [Dokdonella sp.]|uniref:GGDEF domain-containing protein n=1 Tax=Dokdonella sp. TaxID=2291710 RepID=UPI002D807D9E|nr:GGDEF domain-containing protein [Dokdonella sp.]HET9033662.1 GGDEF domain-containing protein [Dokdonella sp.]
MDFHISTAMQLTATITLIIGMALAFTTSGYPRNLQYPIQLWVRGLLIQPFSYALLSMREQIPDWLSIVVANTLLVVSFTLLIQALREYNHRPDRRLAFIVIILLAAAGEILLTYVWPSLQGRIILISLILSIVLLYGLSAIYRAPGPITQPEHLVAIMLGAAIVIMLTRAALTPSSSSIFLTTSSIMQGVVFTYASLMPVIATSGFLLMCGERMNKDLTRLATLDPLTGVFNRRTMTELANKAIAASKRHGRALSLLILDIDHFKRINDQFGHEVGDLALCRFVECVGEVMRESDILARLGGEEFVLILPDTNEKAAISLAERIRKHLCDSEFTVSGWPLPLRASIGVGSLGPAMSNLETLLRETDHAMYEAKRAGRNRIFAASAIRRQSSLDIDPDGATP